MNGLSPWRGRSMIESTFLCLRAEREFFRLLEGDCDLPVGVHATLTNEEITTAGAGFHQRNYWRHELIPCRESPRNL